MEQYDMAMGNKIQKEFIADFQSKNKLSNVFRPFIGKNNFSGDEVSNEIGVDVIKVLERSIVNNYLWKEYTYTVCWREIGEHISCNCRKFEFSGIFCCHIMLVLAQKTFKPSMRVMCSSEKLEFIKERCNEMKDALINWVPTTSDNVPPSQTTKNTEVGGGTPILNPVVTATRGRPMSNRYISRAEERSRGHVRRNYTEANDIEGGGEG
ncbi:hypothetical protein ACS0TY_027443 [Phlomoides rotata]